PIEGFENPHYRYQIADPIPVGDDDAGEADAAQLDEVVVHPEPPVEDPAVNGGGGENIPMGQMPPAAPPRRRSARVEVLLGSRRPITRSMGSGPSANTHSRV
ncbi:unnamed protein product, partial [Allacma fusca]